MKKNKEKTAQQPTTNEGLGQAQNAVRSSEPLTITEAQELLRRMESKFVADVQAKLAPIRDSALETMSSLNAIAEAMEQEQIKLEDSEARHKSVIENSRRAVVSTIKRESSQDLPLPQSVNDVKKFRERMESMLSRFGEVSGSHSKLLNYFLKKQSGKMKHEFGELEQLLKQTRTIVSDFDQQRIPVVKCSNLLNSAAQMYATSKSSENAIKTAESDLDVIEAQAIQTRNELESITRSPDFPESVSAVERIAEIEKKQQVHRETIAAQFSYISRVLSKYSYGLGKEATVRIQILSEEPWRALEDDLQPYNAILSDLRKAVAEGKMQIKDSEKIISYIDSILGTLPEMKQSSLELAREAKNAIDDSRKSLALKAKDLEGTLAKQEEKLATVRQSVDQQKKQLAQRQEETRRILTEAEEHLATLSGTRRPLRES